VDRVEEDTPAILEVPEIPVGTHYTAQIVDEWAEITVNINDRTFPQQPHGAFALCLAGSSPELPDGAVRIDLPSGGVRTPTGCPAQDPARRGSRCCVSICSGPTSWTAAGARRR
jgi:hypothetical protein